MKRVTSGIKLKLNKQKKNIIRHAGSDMMVGGHFAFAGFGQPHVIK